MSLEAAAIHIAEQITRHEYVEVIAHHDADGIAAGSILCHAMFRAGIRFRLRIRREITAADLTNGQAYLLCDLGSGSEDLPRDTMVVDHHQPHFTGEYHANPRLFGIDGDSELSASGTAYLVARNLGDNRDLVGLALLGIMGDHQPLIGRNLEIFNEGVGNGIINPNRGLRLVGRDMYERWFVSINPYLDGISGNENAVSAIMAQVTKKDAVRLDLLLSLSILQVIPHADASCIEEIYGDTYALEREVIPDAHALASVIDACGKSGQGDLGASLCLRSSRDAGAAWEVAHAHRLNVIAAIRTAAGTFSGQDGLFETGDPTVASDLADALACQSARPSPIAVVARDGETCRISARCPPTLDRDLGSVLRMLAQSCGGTGGGHRHRAGATIPCTRIEMFRKGWQEAVLA
jgi:nanoRNase/pAp phosphatase (c-di-AMP/oligoRNAs hydrolase)